MTLLALQVIACAPPPSSVAPSPRETAWVTQEEAKLPEADIARARLPSDGPRILVIKPKNQETIPSPVDIEIRFEPREQSEVMLDSLKIEYIKFLTIDITDRIRPYATQEGIRGDGVEFPEGKHRIRISLKDSLGRLTAKEFSIRVEEV